MTVECKDQDCLCQYRCRRTFAPGVRAIQGLEPREMKDRIVEFAADEACTIMKTLRHCGQALWVLWPLVPPWRCCGGYPSWRDNPNQDCFGCSASVGLRRRRPMIGLVLQLPCATCDTGCTQPVHRQRTSDCRGFRATSTCVR